MLERPCSDERWADVEPPPVHLHPSYPTRALDRRWRRAARRQARMLVLALIGWLVLLAGVCAGVVVLVLAFIAASR